MASKATLRRQRSSGKVVAAGRTHKKAISAAMGETFGEEIAQPVERLVEVTADHLEVKAAEMVRADEAHIEELRDDPAAREARDALVCSIRDTLVSSREQLSIIMGDEYVTRLGFDGKTPEGPLELLRVARVVADNLTGIPAPEPSLPGYVFDPSSWADRISAPLGDLEGSVAAVDREAREAEATLSAKNKAIGEYDRAFSCTANLLSALLDMAGEEELARKVRPSTRRTGQTVEDAQNPDPAL